MDTGTLVERVNFATRQLGDAEKPGVKAMIDGVASRYQSAISPETLVDACLDQVGAIAVGDDTKRVLVDFAAAGGDLRLGPGSLDEASRERIAAMLQMVASTQEFQRA